MQDLLILGLMLGWAILKAYSDGSDNRWHLNDTLSYFAFGAAWIMIAIYYNWTAIYLCPISWIFAGAPFEYLLCIIWERPQERTLHLDEIWSKLPLLRWRGWKMWLWDGVRIVGGIVLWILLTGKV